MPYDDIVIGSGLSALGATLGLHDDGRRILIVAGANVGLRHYPGTNVPSARGGRGGLGEYWHGVIPLGLHNRPKLLDDAHWSRLAQYFYPAADLAAHIGKERYFVPRRPIRPTEHFAKLARNPSIEIADLDVQLIQPSRDSTEHTVLTTTGERFSARRLWICAGALGTPALLSRSGLIDRGERTVSDHIIGYAGQVAATPAIHDMMKTIERGREGVFFPYRSDTGRRHFFTLRPARFDFTTLDAGIAKRAVFGLPTNRVISGITGNMSPGLVAEALYNKFGLFPHAALYSVYFQTAAPKLYSLNDEGQLSLHSKEQLSDIVANAHRAAPFANLVSTRQRELYIPGIHLHGSLTREECERFGPGGEFDTIHLSDAAAMRNIGPEHHSFAMMAAAYRRAVSAASQD